LSLPSRVSAEITDNLDDLKQKSLITPTADSKQIDQTLLSSPLVPLSISDEKISEPLLIVLDESDDDDLIVAEKVAKQTSETTEKNIKTKKLVENTFDNSTWSTEQLNNEQTSTALDFIINTTSTSVIAETITMEKLSKKSTTTTKNVIKTEHNESTKNQLPFEIENNDKLNDIHDNLNDTINLEMNKQQQTTPVQNQKRKRSKR
ncbi:unnamed protein product, partial [Didymodactylos carnosus]